LLRGTEQAAEVTTQETGEAELRTITNVESVVEIEQFVRIVIGPERDQLIARHGHSSMISAPGKAVVS
jgi:hypothetical protein